MADSKISKVSPDQCKFYESVNKGKNVSKSDKNITFGLLNLRSLTRKYDGMYELMSDGMDVLVLTESWHGSSENIALRLAMPPDFCFVDFVRPHDPYHGGIIVFFRSAFRCTKLDLPPLKTFEAVLLKLFINKIEIVLLAIYRPGSSLPTPMFLTELMSVMEHIVSITASIILAGDFNIHIERRGDPHASSLLEIFDLYQIFNQINEPTHNLGGVLDLVVTSSNLLPFSCKVFPSGIYSDHSLIVVELPLKRQPVIVKQKIVRSWKRMNENLFISLVQASPIGGHCLIKNVDDSLRLFENELRRIVDVVAPLHSIKSRYVPISPWFDDECRVHKRTCRRLERVFRRNPCDIAQTAWVNALDEKIKIFSLKKNCYWKNLVTSNSANPKVLWKVLNAILNRDFDGSTGTDVDLFIFQIKLLKYVNRLLVLINQV